MTTNRIDHEYKRVLDDAMNRDEAVTLLLHNGHKVIGIPRHVDLVLVKIRSDDYREFTLAMRSVAAIQV